MTNRFSWGIWNSNSWLIASDKFTEILWVKRMWRKEVWSNLLMKTAWFFFGYSSSVRSLKIEVLKIASEKFTRSLSRWRLWQKCFPCDKLISNLVSRACGNRFRENHLGKCPKGQNESLRNNRIHFFLLMVRCMKLRIVNSCYLIWLGSELSTWACLHHASHGHSGFYICWQRPLLVVLSIGSTTRRFTNLHST